jgi:hypothetical protein
LIRGDFCDGPREALRYAARVNTENALKLMFELRAVLNRMGGDASFHETLAGDLDRATRLTDACISQLTQESDEPVSEDDEDD